jgi:hypothetical protein
MRHIGGDLTVYQHNIDKQTPRSLDKLACAGGNIDMDFIERETNILIASEKFNIRRICHCNDSSFYTTKGVNFSL